MGYLDLVGIKNQAFRVLPRSSATLTLKYLQAATPLLLPLPLPYTCDFDISLPATVF